ncbi:hypothetical protein SAMN04487847_1756 [Microbacterium sp. cf332]|nr:hypothetical protein SAMN04487847_1756 [Microbacterium sp. cf332]
MRAVQITEYGDPSVLTITDVTLPAPGNGQVLVDVRAAALNPLDIKLRSGAAHSLYPCARARPPGL